MSDRYKQTLLNLKLKPYGANGEVGIEELVLYIYLFPNIY